MRTVAFAGWPHPVSALGFGCASLGSRISRKAGVAAIERALAAGVSWFDVAPSYGDGEAEGILGEALTGAKVAIVTKVGLTASRASGLKKLIRSSARPIIAAVPGLRALAKTVRAGEIERLPLTGEIIRTSISRSLERLRIDRVAALMLHDPDLNDVRRDEVLRALEDVKRQGLAARVGIAGSFTSFAAANATNKTIDVAQFAADPMQCAQRAETLGRQGVFAVVHSVFAVQEALVRNGAAPDSALRYCFGANPAGVVLASSFRAEHLAMNVAAANAVPDPAFAAEIEASLRGESGSR